jgi:hypothetical protein
MLLSDEQIKELGGHIRKARAIERKFMNLKLLTFDPSKYPTRFIVLFKEGLISKIKALLLLKKT